MSSHTTLRPHAKPQRLLLALSVPLLLAGGILAGVIAFRTSPTPAHAASGLVPAGLPGHFSFGTMDSPGGTSYLNGMRSQNGTAWDYRYQYLSGGAGTGWTTWNQPAGAFATYYLQDSASNGYMPAFVYYQMLQSSGPSGSGESGTDLAHLASASTMSAYYGDWTLLMQKIGAFGKPALVIVEPDLWGYIEQAAQNAGTNSAASIPASVASSGNADAAGFANTAQGFAYALLHIRDHYAPNAVLALHASAWGTGIDIASNTSPSLDVASIAAKTAAFLKTEGLTGTPSGVSTFDAVSNDIADHDSGQSGNWWDRNNVTFPNFRRYLQYASALSADSGRGILMWQVPVGNQYFDTENNSSGHTQDNKAEYILSHIADFANAGVIGVLFGPGNSGTSVQDGKHDGVTNPAPISTYECNGCNNHTSVYADDDGGYLRINVGNYYKSGGYPLGGGTPPTPTATPTGSPTGSPTGTPTACTPQITFSSGGFAPSTTAAGATTRASISLTASCSTTALVDFEAYNAAGTKVWQTAQNNAALTGQTQTFTASWAVPTSTAAGRYTLKVGVFTPNWGTLYGWDASAATLTVQSSAPACSGTPAITFGSGSAAPASPARGSTVTLSATLTSSCRASALIDFEVYNAAGQKAWQSWQDNTSLTGAAQTFTASWAVSASQATGAYTLKIGVFGPGWSTFYAWNGSATTFTVK